MTRIIYKLWDWYIQYGTWLSVSKLCWLIGQLGIVGYIWLLRIFDKRFKDDNPTFIIAFFMLSIFDTYFEIPCVFILVLIATYVNPETKNIPFDNRKQRL